MKSTQMIMGMPVTLELAATDAAAAPVMTETFDWFRHVDATFSTYKPDSPISRLNRGELTNDELTDEVRKVLAECADYARRTDGYFDINRPDGGIDPSGFVKGWAIAKAAGLVRDRGIGDFYVSAGADVQTWGVNSKGEPWLVGIRHPDQPKKYAKLVRLTGAAIATSGTYERGSHIYDPRTGQPAEAFVSLSVVGPDICLADTLATAAFAMGLPGLKFLQREGFEAFAIMADRRVLATPGFAAFEA